MTTPADETPSSPPTAPTSFVVRGPGDLAAFVPVALGFRPRDSVTMLGLGGPEPFHARVDLPTRPDAVAEVVEALLAPARQHRVQQVAFVLHGDDTPVVDELGWALAAAFAAASIGVIHVLRVHDDHWFAVLPGDPPEHYRGVPLALDAHPFTAQAVAAGRVTVGSREELRASLATDGEAAARVEAVARARGVPRLARVGAVGGLVDHHVRRGTRCDDTEVVDLAVGVADPRRRDEVWRLLDRDSAVAQVGLWADVVRRCPRGLVADPAAVLAVVAWLRGNGALAWCAVDRCRETEPDHRLAGVVAQLLQSATPPTAWERVRSGLGAQGAA
jgi:hypothetical protein